jgi:nucleoside-diphosphate-sugar epimerase
MKKICILGVNGFIGHHLSNKILADTDYEVYGMDMSSERVRELTQNKRFHFFEGDITINREWIEYHIRKCDVILPLVAIATPATYVREPLKVFELDFEANLPIIRSCVKYGKRVLFPSTSRSTGCARTSSSIPTRRTSCWGPIDKQRWIYSCSKQLMDRVIYAYGSMGQLDFTLFAPSTGSARAWTPSTRRRKAARASSRSSSGTSCAASRSSSWTAARRNAPSPTSTTASPRS